MKTRVFPLTLLLLAVAAVQPAWGGLPPGYAPSVRPDPPGVPTRVSMGIFLLDLAEIDDLKQEFTVDLYITASWRDSRLANAEDELERVLPLASIWSPAIGALNRRAITFLLPETARVDREGNVFYTQRIFGNFASPLDLHQFPSDEQQLPIRLAAYRYGTDELEIEVDAARSGRLDDLSIAGWRVGEAGSETTPLEVPGATRAGVTFRVSAQRETTYYLLTMAIPMLLIALMAWAVFWIDPAYFPSQIGVSTASVFTLIAFRFSLAVSLPKVSYLTTADWFILAVTLLVFGALGEAVYTGGLAKRGKEDLARRIDGWARWLYLGALIVLCLFSL